MAPQEIKLSRRRYANSPDNGWAINTSDAVKYLLGVTDEPRIREREIQALLFIAEANWRDNNEYFPPPLLNTEFKKIRRGVFSQEIREAVEEMGLRSRPSFERMGRTTVYDISLLDAPAVEKLNGQKVEKAAAFIEAVVKEFSSLDGDELMQRCLEFSEVSDLTSGQVVRFESSPVN